MSAQSKQWIWLAVAALLLASAGVLLEGYSLRLLNLALLNVITVIGLNLAFGYCGIIHLGQAAFVGIGAYVTALATVKLGWPMAISIPVAMIAAASFALLVSLPLIRLKGHYLALATVGVNVILELIAKNWVEVTNGYNGVTGIPRLTDMMPGMAPEKAFIPIVSVAALVVVWVALRLRHSHLGRGAPQTTQHRRLDRCTARTDQRGAHMRTAYAHGLLGGGCGQHSKHPPAAVVLWAAV